jgi:hypothetical protein
MIEHSDGTRTPVIDASVHVFFASNTDLRDHLHEPFKSRGFPDYESDWYGAPGGVTSATRAPIRKSLPITCSQTAVWTLPCYIR